MISLEYVVPWAGGANAVSWYLSQPIPPLEGLTASELVNSDRGDQLLACLEAMAEGGYA